MQHISVMLTKQQVLDRTKFVSRRLNWHRLKASTLLQPIEKGQGLKKGEHPVAVGRPVLVVKVRRERLDKMLDEPYGRSEAKLEGFPEMSGRQFVSMFCEHMKCKPTTVITRIEWRYTDLPEFGQLDQLDYKQVSLF